MTIGERIAELLVSKSLREIDLARHLGTRQSTVQGWTKLGRSPSADFIIPICEFFNISPSYLLVGHEIEPPTTEQLKEWIDKDGNQVIASDEEAELARLRINEALTKRIEEVVQEALKDRESKKD